MTFNIFLKRSLKFILQIDHYSFNQGNFAFSLWLMQDENCQDLQVAVDNLKSFGESQKNFEF